MADKLTASACSKTPGLAGHVHSSYPYVIVLFTPEDLDHSPVLIWHGKLVGKVFIVLSVPSAAYHAAIEDKA